MKYPIRMIQAYWTNSTVGLFILFEMENGKANIDVIIDYETRLRLIEFTDDPISYIHYDGPNLNITKIELSRTQFSHTSL